MPREGQGESPHALLTVFATGILQEQMFIEVR